MVPTEMNVVSKGVVPVLFACLLLLAGITCSRGESVAGGARSCSFPQYLENPGSRARYEEALDKARRGSGESRTDVEAMYGSIVPARLTNGNFVDEFSLACLSCHDGLIAREVSPKMPESPGSRMQMIIEKHPIGVDYASYADSRGRFKNIYAVDPRIVFVDGRLSCVTCHDPLNPEPFHLALNSTWSELCLNCHNV